MFEAIDYVEKKDIVKAKATNFTSRKTERSMIHPQYADRFIRQYVIDENIWMK